MINEDPRESIRPRLKRDEETKKLQTISTVTIASSNREVDYTPLPSNQWSENGFILTEIIGSGGEGIVWKGVQVSLDREVAIKLLINKESKTDPEQKIEFASACHSFYQEALIAAKLEHPNIVPIHEIGLTEDGSPLLAMKLVRGKLWSEVIYHDFQELSEEDFLQKHLQIFIGMMQGVAFAHSQGIVHRDLKPSQVMLGEFGEVLLIDWGIALVVENTAQSTSARPSSDSSVFKLPTIETASNPAGTPALMAPEQTTTAPDNISYHTDIYLLGGILYYLLCDSYPHDAETTEEAMNRAKSGSITPPSERKTDRVIPQELESLALKALELDPNNRPFSVKEMIHSIEDYLTGTSAKRKSIELSSRAESLLAKLEKENSELQLENKKAFPSLHNQDLNYEHVFSVIEEIRQLNSEALKGWGNNQSIHENSDRLNRIGAITAVRSGDLRMASHLMNQINSSESKSFILHLIDSEKQRRKLKDSYRRGAYVLIGILLLLIGGGITKYNHDLSIQNEALEIERDLAENSKNEAMKRSLEAEVATANAVNQEYLSNISLAALSFKQENISKVHEILSNQTLPELRHWEWGNLWYRTMGDSMTLITQTGVAENLSAEISPDGNRIYTGDRSGNLCVWNGKTGKLLNTIKLHNDGIWDISVSDDNTKLMTSSFDLTAKYIDTNTMEVIHVFGPHENLLRGGDISPDGKIAVTTQRGGSITLWDTETGEKIPDENTISMRSYDAEFSHNGKYLSIAHGQQGTLHDAKTGKLISMTDVQLENVLSVSFSPDDTKLVTACTDRFARVYSVPDLKLLMEIPNVTSWLHSTDWTPDGRYIVTSDNKGTCRLWNSETGEMAYEINSFERMFHVQVSDDGQFILTVSSKGTQLWNIDQLSKEEGLDVVGPVNKDLIDIDFSDHVYAMPFEAQGNWIGYDNAFRRETDNGRLTYQYREHRFAIDSYYATFEPNGNRVFRIEYPETSVVIEDQITGQKIQDWELDEVFMARWSPNGKCLAVFNVDGETSLYDAETLTKKTVLGTAVSFQNYTSAKHLGDMRFSNDGKMIIIGRRNGSAEVYSTETGELIQEYETDEDAVFSVAFSPDSSLVAIGYLSTNVFVYETLTGKMISELIGNQDISLTISFHPDNKRLVTASQDDLVSLWELENGREVMTVFDLADNRFLLGAGFTPDGKNVYCIASDQSIYIAGSMDWKVEGSSKEIMRQMEAFKRQKYMNPSVTVDDVDFDFFVRE